MNFTKEEKNLLTEDYHYKKARFKVDNILRKLSNGYLLTGEERNQYKKFFKNFETVFLGKSTKTSD